MLRTAQYIKLPQYVGTGILWNTEMKNIYYCAIQCASYEKCVAFFYQKKTCSGYDQIIPAAEDLIPYVGKTFYDVQKPSSQGNSSFFFTFFCVSYNLKKRGNHGRDRMVVEFTTTHAISACHH